MPLEQELLKRSLSKATSIDAPDGPLKRKLAGVPVTLGMMPITPTSQLGSIGKAPMTLDKAMEYIGKTMLGSILGKFKSDRIGSLTSNLFGQEEDGGQAVTGINSAQKATIPYRQ